MADAFGASGCNASELRLGLSATAGRSDLVTWNGRAR